MLRILLARENAADNLLDNTKCSCRELLEAIRAAPKNSRIKANGFLENSRPNRSITLSQTGEFDMVLNATPITKLVSTYPLIL